MICLLYSMYRGLFHVGCIWNDYITNIDFKLSRYFFFFSHRHYTGFGISFLSLSPTALSFSQIQKEKRQKVSHTPLPIKTTLSMAIVCEQVRRVFLRLQGSRLWQFCCILLPWSTSASCNFCWFMNWRAVGLFTWTSTINCLFFFFFFKPPAWHWLWHLISLTPSPSHWYKKKRKKKSLTRSSAHQDRSLHGGSVWPGQGCFPSHILLPWSTSASCNYY